MIDLGPYAVFIWGAYAGTAVTVLALIAGVALDARRQQARLARLEAQGIRRRSASPERR